MSSLSCAGVGFRCDLNGLRANLAQALQSQGQMGGKRGGRGFRQHDIRVPLGSAGPGNVLKPNSNQNLTAFTRVIIPTAFYFLGGLLNTSEAFLSGSFAMTDLLEAKGFSVLQARTAERDLCSGYLTKPIDTRRFCEQIAGFLGVSPPGGLCT